MPLAEVEYIMKTPSNGSIFRITGFPAGNSPVTGKFPAQRPGTQGFDVFWYAPEQTIVQTIVRLVIWDAIVLIMSEWVIWFDGLFGNSGHRGPYSLYELHNYSLYIRIIIFPHIDNTQSKGYNQLYEKRN